MREKVLLLVIMRKKDRSRSVGDVQEEMRELIYSSNGNVIDSIIANIEKPTPSYFLRKGKLEEVETLVCEHKPSAVIVNIDLSPIQSRNLEKYLKVRVVDRTALILDIFAQRAKSSDGKLQVELAQYTYLLPRLSAIWEEFSRLGGGIGTRGPGEKILERDRRKIRKHITKLEKELDRLKRHRALIRTSRKRKDFPIVSIVGYTNAGKSSLLRRLTGADVLIEDKLFATLDPITRKYVLPNGKEVLFTDTVGFLLDLPHDLIKAFYATLEEVNEADLVLVVIDGSNPEYHLHYEVVQKILKEIKALNKKQLIICNKTDLMQEKDFKNVQAQFDEVSFVSIKTGDGIEAAVEKIQEKICYEYKDNFAEKE